jgi:hypothetical protein
MEKILHAGYFQDIIKAFLPMERKKITANRVESGKRGDACRRTGEENDGSGELSGVPSSIELPGGGHAKTGRKTGFFSLPIYIFADVRPFES